MAFGRELVEILLALLCSIRRPRSPLATYQVGYPGGVDAMRSAASTLRRRSPKVGLIFLTQSSLAQAAVAPFQPNEAPGTTWRMVAVSFS